MCATRTVNSVTKAWGLALLSIGIFHIFPAQAQEDTSTDRVEHGDNAQGHHHKHHHYKLVDLGTFGGPGSTTTEFQQVLTNHGTVVGGADTSSVSPYPNCSNPFNAPDCYVQHAFEWRGGELTDLGTLPSGSSSFAYFIGDDGLIVGGSEISAIDPATGTPETLAVLWRNGEIKDLGTLGGTSSVAFQANNAGQVIGVSLNTLHDPFSPSTQTRGFIWQKGKMHDLGTLGGPLSFAQYVNDRGQVAGVSYTSDIPDPNTGLPQLDPFLWENGKMKDLGNLGGSNGPLGPFIFGLNSHGQVVGFMTVQGDVFDHAFIWDGEKLSDLNTGGGLGGNYSFANGLNDAGEVIGNATLPADQVYHAFLWRNGVMTDLGTLRDDPCSTAQSINSRRQVVGASQSACNSFFTSAFLWEKGGPSVDLNTLVPPGSAMNLTGAFWINDRGEITGRGVPQGCNNVDTCGHAYVLIPCDENHADVEGCDYDAFDAETAAQGRPAQISGRSAPTSGAKLAPTETMNRYGSAMSRRNQRLGGLSKK
jgi:probable HAF family extracellular repeat protein